MNDLSAEELQTFVAGLSGLSPVEVRKAKQLYIRNAVSEYNALVEQHKAVADGGCIHNMIPLFWPMLRAQRRAMAAEERLQRERIENAVAVWEDNLDGLRVKFGDGRASVA